MSSSSEEDLTKMVIGGLLRGKEVATQLKTLLQKRVDDNDYGSLLLAEELAVEIFRSFNEMLSVLNCGGGENIERSQIVAEDHGGSASSGESNSKKSKKDRRGCYKRRKSSDSWTKVSPTVEDGCAWRKYGQKFILNAQYPRSYFRCTLKNEGCKATKQVQRIKEDPTLYQTTYFGQHTCRGKTRGPHINIDTDPPESNDLVSFEEKVPLVNAIPTIPLKEETAQSESSDAKSSPDSSLWLHDMNFFEPLMIWSPKIRYSDMEGVDQFGNLDFDF